MVRDIAPKIKTRQYCQEFPKYVLSGLDARWIFFKSWTYFDLYNHLNSQLNMYMYNKSYFLNDPEVFWVKEHNISKSVVDDDEVKLCGS